MNAPAMVAALKLVLALDNGAGPDVVKLAPKTREQIERALAGDSETARTVEEARKQLGRCLIHACKEEHPSQSNCFVAIDALIAAAHAEGKEAGRREAFEKAAREVESPAVWGTAAYRIRALAAREKEGGK